MFDRLFRGGRGLLGGGRGQGRGNKPGSGPGGNCVCPQVRTQAPASSESKMYGHDVSQVWDTYDT
jgi:hypothetical protein